MSDDDNEIMRAAKKADESLKLLIGIVTSVVTIGTAIVTFVRGVGGLQQFLIEVGMLGIAGYVALFVIVAPVLAAVEGLENLTRRETTPVGMAVVVAVAAVGGATFVRFALFADNLTTDLDDVGTAFLVVVGVAVLAVPLAALWFLTASKPATA